MKKKRKGQTRPLCKLTDAYRPNKSPLLRTSQPEHPRSSNTENRRSANMENHTYPSTCIYRQVHLHCYRLTSTAINYPNIVCSKSKTEPNGNTVRDIYWKRKRERKRESELTYPPARPCSASNLQCESQLESLGFSVAPPTQCHVTLTTPPQLQQWKKRRDGQRKERKKAGGLSAWQSTHTKLRGWISISPHAWIERKQTTLRFRTVLHWWFMSYELPELSCCSSNCRNLRDPGYSGEKPKQYGTEKLMWLHYSRIWDFGL